MRRSLSSFTNFFLLANSILLANDGICYIPHLWAINKQSELTLIPDGKRTQGWRFTNAAINSISYGETGIRVLWWNSAEP